MRHYTSTILACLILSSFLACGPQDRPPPTDGKTEIRNGDETGNADKRQAWLLNMHKAAPADHWTQLEYQNQLERLAQRPAIDLRSNCDAISVAGDKLRGQWMERGSQNQAGSVIDTEYDPVNEEIWLISAGGTLWRGRADGSAWNVVNQDYIFSSGALAFISNRADRRLFALINKEPHYSDDDGLNWTASAGTPKRNDYWGGSENIVILKGAVSTIFLLAKPDYWSELGLYVSTDLGESFQKIKSFDTNLFSQLHLSNPHHSQSVFLVDNSQETAMISEYTPHTGVFTAISTESNLSFGETRINLRGWSQGDSLVLYSYSKNEEGELGVFQSTDRALTWNYQGKLPKAPWEVGLYVCPSNPEVLMMGEVECFRSLDAGKSWSRINRWADYYDDIVNNLHADIMHFNEFETTEGESFLLVSNHGGLSISYDYFSTQTNIGLHGLNVSQYYSVVTDPLDPTYVYAGSQDQGFQRAGGFTDSEEGSEHFDQVISGDYGHLTFSKGGQSLWAVYPEGWITYYDDPQNLGYKTSFQLDEGQRSELWMPPLMPSPIAEEDAIYMAGGSLSDDEGSYLIKLSAAGHSIESEAGTFDFKAASVDGQISALASAPSNPNYWYVATDNGRFFYSKDAGENWEQSINFIVQGQFFYGQAIHVSQTNENTVYLAGSGYSNSAVFISKDGGENFAPLNHGLPPTLVLGLAADPDAQFLFAATETGPYVHVNEENRWYPLLGSCAPTHTYWSVEYVESLHTARFGTFGRGIWDFVLDPMVNTNSNISQADFDYQLYPNPTQDWLQVKLGTAPTQGVPMQLIAVNGQVIRQISLKDQETRIDLTDLPAGTYWVNIQQNGRSQSQVVIIVD